MTPAGRAEGVVVRVFGVVSLVFLVTPMLVVALASLDPGLFFTFPPRTVSVRWYSEFLSDEAWRSSLSLSLVIATLSAMLAMLLGGMAGIAVARAPAMVRGVLYPILVAPLIVPVIVLALSFYGVVLRLHVVGNIMTFVAADTLLTAPLVALLVVGTALGMDPRLEFASLACGAGPWRTVARVTVPVVAPTALAGGVMAFLLALDEVVMSIFLVSPGRTPLAVRMFLQLQNGGTAPIITAAATLLMVGSVVVIAVFTLARNRVMARRRAQSEAEADAALLIVPVSSR